MTEQQPFIPGDSVEIVEGPFATFIGKVREVNYDKQVYLVEIPLGNNPNILVGYGEVAVELRFQEVKRTV